MTTVIGVRFKTSGRIYYFDPTGFTIEENDGVIVETARGTEFGEVAQPPHEVEDDQVVQPLKPILRVATAEDRRMRDQNAAKEGDAFRICQKKIEQHQLDMKLVDVEYAFNGSKVVFYFTADERVDFRELVKDLAAQFRTRIELRQIGVRDEAKMLGGLGSCGRPVCCKAFLGDFHPVSIKMAKEQNLSLSPTKISGLCGRLMCCLQYEQAAYEDMKKKMPKTGKEIQTPDGVGTVIENNAVTERTRVRLTERSRCVITIIRNSRKSGNRFRRTLSCRSAASAPRKRRRCCAASTSRPSRRRSRPTQRNRRTRTNRAAEDGAGDGTAAESSPRRSRERTRSRRRSRKTASRSRTASRVTAINRSRAGRPEDGSPSRAAKNSRRISRRRRRSRKAANRPCSAGAAEAVQIAERAGKTGKPAVYL